MYFLTIEQVMELHRKILAEYGGADGIRDHGLLESALAMPQATFGGQLLHDGIPAMAAAYLFHICRNHPLVDGNKRVALGSAVIFLYANGQPLVAGKDEVEELALHVADGSASKDQVTEFFRRHVRDDAAKKPGRRSRKRKS